MLIPYLLAVSVAKLALAAAEDNKTKLRVVNFLSGPDSRATSPQVFLARNTEQWKAVWNVHRTAFTFGASTGVTAADETYDMPAIRFDKDMVLAVFGGDVRGVIGYAVVDAGTKDHRDYVNLRPVFTPPTGGFTIGLNPYAFVELTRTPRALDVFMLTRTGNQSDGVLEKVMSFPKLPEPGK